MHTDARKANVTEQIALWTRIQAMDEHEVEALSPEQARRLTDRIKASVEAIWELVIEAYQLRAWDALGYASWDDYCTREFGACRLRLPREERQEVVSSLREAGLNTRAIAAATGIGHKTVHRDLDPGVSNDTPADAEPVDVVDAELPEDDPVATASPDPPAPAPAVTGTDGKTYPKAPARPPTKKRAPLLKEVDAAGWQLRRAVERIERLRGDHRFDEQLDEVATFLGDHVRMVADLPESVLLDVVGPG